MTTQRGERPQARYVVLGTLTVVAVVALAAYALGAGKAAKKVTFCAAKSGDVSLAHGAKCDRGEKKLSIAKQGPAGPQGPAGERGPAGTTASIQPEAPQLVRSSNQGVCAPDVPGVFCATPGAWRNLPPELAGNGPPVSFQMDASGFVHLAGDPRLDSGTATGAIFYLPPAYRPTNGLLEFLVKGDCTGANTTGTIDIALNGAVIPSDGEICPSLDGISYYP